MEQLVFSNRAAVAAACLALVFAFSNGFRDSSTIVATVVSARVLAPFWAFMLCALFEFGGTLLIGSAIASTVGAGVLGDTLVYARGNVFLVILAGLSSAIVWGAICGWRSWPTSNNQALIAGLAGASWACCGEQHIRNVLLLKMTGVLILTPLIGFVVSVVLTAALRVAGEWMTAKFRRWTDALHVLACLMVSSAHGSNNGQMVMAVLVAVIGVAAAVPGAPTGEIPANVRMIVALAITGGVLLGGRTMVRKMGMKFYRVRSLEGVGALASAAGTVLASGMSGFPASTTQVVAGSIVGAGVAKNPKAVRWQIAREIVLSWLITLPAAALLGFLFSEAALTIRSLRS